MNTSELMIGDWVKFNNSDLAHKVIAIAGKSIKVDKVYWYSANKFRPIPLTPEIFEKNGFTYNSEPFSLYWEYRGKDLHIHNCVNIKYVHEFQHGLRLLGIEKEIVL